MTTSPTMIVSSAPGINVIASWEHPKESMKPATSSMDDDADFYAIQFDVND
jgi:hypothetical protein